MRDVGFQSRYKDPKEASSLVFLLFFMVKGIQRELPFLSSNSAFHKHLLKRS